MEYIETGRIISTDICRQFIGTDDSFTAFKLKSATFICIPAKGGHHFTQPVVSSVFLIYLPAGSRFNHGFVQTILYCIINLHALKFMMTIARNLSFVQQQLT
ncbi:hypothetical protein QUF90_25360 [Desulfococcaceae bacterium HSG9]|nr:hypothetical protein [Desulfococcaceae bacterium HSG9]